ncbi:hypothetical protein L1987_61205 [Smallanthus sonchifolius]|uniref:Uncharacterized protein n=1 Tax=Smallanthus sonchifolius TaxID=185202 RepID=A0ACB9DAJ7_9ASTR|nr:hypothetical protein L1987_61205 [Smallanthus sonchifolius]
MQLYLVRLRVPTEESGRYNGDSEEDSGDGGLSGMGDLGFRRSEWRRFFRQIWCESCSLDKAILFAVAGL